MARILFPICGCIPLLSCKYANTFVMLCCHFCVRMQMNVCLLWNRGSCILDVSVFSASADVIFVSERLYLHDGRIAYVITDVGNAGCVANISFCTAFELIVMSLLMKYPQKQCTYVKILCKLVIPLYAASCTEPISNFLAIL